MTKIHTPVEGFTGTVVGVDFKDGIGETDDVAALGYFARQGYEIEPAGDGVPAIPEGDPSKSWTKPQLTAWAETCGLDLGKASTKDAILAVITTTEAPDPGDTPPPADDKPGETSPAE